MAVEQQFVSLSLGAEDYAVPVAWVREILDQRTCFALPSGPDYLLGLIDVRGRELPLIDLRRRLGLPPGADDADRRILVVDIPQPEQGRSLALALLADRVRDVIAVDSEAIGEAPAIGAWRLDAVAGIARHDGVMVAILDLPRLFADHPQSGDRAA